MQLRYLQRSGAGEAQKAATDLYFLLLLLLLLLLIYLYTYTYTHTHTPILSMRDVARFKRAL